MARPPRRTDRSTRLSQSPYHSRRNQDHEEQHREDQKDIHHRHVRRGADEYEGHEDQYVHELQEDDAAEHPEPIDDQSPGGWEDGEGKNERGHDDEDPQGNDPNEVDDEQDHQLDDHEDHQQGIDQRFDERVHVVDRARVLQIDELEGFQRTQLHNDVCIDASHQRVVDIDELRDQEVRRPHKDEENDEVDQQASELMAQTDELAHHPEEHHQSEKKHQERSASDPERDLPHLLQLRVVDQDAGVLAPIEVVAPSHQRVPNLAHLVAEHRVHPVEEAANRLIDRLGGIEVRKDAGTPGGIRRWLHGDGRRRWHRTW